MLRNVIVCATRGGEGSRAVQMAAIAEAKAMQQPLVFFYATDVQSLGNVNEALLAAVRSELNWMGKTLLSIAQHRADMAGLQTDVVIRVGDFRMEIERFLRENGVQKLMLGAPRGSTANIFGDDAIEQFAQMIEQDTAVPVQIIRPESMRRGE